MFTPVISCLTTCNFPWFMDLTIQVPMQSESYAVSTAQILLLSWIPPTTGCCLCFGPIPSFFLELFLLWSPVPYWAPTDLGSSSFSILSFLPFHTVHVVLMARILKWFVIPFSSGPHSVRPLHHDPSVLGDPTWHGLVSLCYTRLWSVWLDWLVSCDYGLCVCPLMPLRTPIILLGFLLPWMWGISSWLLQPSGAAAPDFGCGAFSCSGAEQLPFLGLFIGNIIFQRLWEIVWWFLKKFKTQLP